MSDFDLNEASRESYRFDSDEHAGDVRAETDHCPVGFFSGKNSAQNAF
jgi:hypothetical protein